MVQSDWIRHSARMTISNIEKVWNGQSEIINVRKVSYGKIYKYFEFVSRRIFDANI